MRIVLFDAALGTYKKLQQLFEKSLWLYRDERAGAVRGIFDALQWPFPNSPIHLFEDQYDTLQGNKASLQRSVVHRSAFSMCCRAPRQNPNQQVAN
ncbi:unnamed protein product [Gongylonema pulchrum]|uniref:Uncharacterized protein n=1 Tax=Gongylonema pulchrum TaxID=637853 RepID=A0A3P6S8L6_9BILA|nr:unnamed protein product [Gongylonema pulchrum]